jgi:hypothetical protein
MAKGDNFRGAKPEGSGRQKGVPNKATLSVRDGLQALWNERGISDIKGSLDAAEPEARADVWAKVIKYFAPALSTQQVIQDQPTQQVIRVEVVTPPPADEGSE